MSGAGNEQDRVPWPPTEDAERLATYARGELLYRGEHEAVFCRAPFKWKHDTRREYIATNLLAALTNLLVSRMFGEGVKLSAPEGDEAGQSFIDWLVAQNKLSRRFVEAARTSSYAGDAWLKVRYDLTTAKIRVALVPPATVFAEWDPMDGEQLVAASVARVLCDGDKTYLLVERNELRRDGQGWITNRLWELREDALRGSYTYDPVRDERELNTLALTESLMPEYPTGVPCLLLIHAPNRTVGSCQWGVPDYDRALLSIQGELNWRRTHRSEVTDKLADPWVIGPILGGASTDPETGEPDAAILTDMKYIERMGEDTTVEVITWDAQMPTTENTIHDLTEQAVLCY